MRYEAIKRKPIIEYMSEEDTAAKQEFLRVEILEADYDTNHFLEFMSTKRGIFTFSTK